MNRFAVRAAAVLAFASVLVGAAQAKTAAATAPAGPAAADWRTPDPQDLLVIDTNKGRILVELAPEIAPNHVARVRELARAGFYDGLRFFRVIDGFMAQTGDPRNTGEGGSDKPDLAAEFSFRRGPASMAVVADQTVAEFGFVKSAPVSSQSAMLMPMTADGKVSAWPLFCPGVAGMARAGDPNSANSQFFLMRDAYPALERRYTGFGRVIFGLAVVRAIKTGEPVADPQDRMERVRILADIPASDRPKVRVIDPAGAWFKAEVERNRAARGGQLAPCEIEIPVEVK